MIKSRNFLSIFAVVNICSFQDASVEELQEHKKELENKVQPIIGKLYKDQGVPPPESTGAGDDKDEL